MRDWPTCSPVPTRRVLLSPDEGGSAPAAPPAPPAPAPGGAPGAQAPAAPPAPGPEHYVSQGLLIGQQRVLAELGVKDIAEVRALVEAGRKASQGTPQGGQPPADISQHPEYRKLGAELGEYREKTKKYEADHERLTRMADEARRGKVRELFLAAGSGPEQAADAVALFHDRFEMSPEGALATLGQLADGTRAPLGQKPEALAAELLKTRPYLVAPKPAGGVGTKTSKVKPPDTGGGERKSIWGGTGESRVQKVMKRRSGK